MGHVELYFRLPRSIGHPWELAANGLYAEIKGRYRREGQNSGRTEALGEGI